MNAAVERTLGWILRGVRGHDKHLAWDDTALATLPATITLTSAAFAANGPIPQRHAGKGVGANTSPPMAWSGIPDETAELTIVIEDPDAPLPRPVVHCIAASIAPGMSGLAEGALDALGHGIRLGRGSMGSIGYAGPRPVLGHGPHRYFFQIVAASRPLQLKEDFKLSDLIEALRGAAIAKGRLIGTYERP
jgi:Raf kinase inhibitor-like YbhB/YbcL family protein